jgi:hypothetical protein
VLKKGLNNSIYLLDRAVPKAIGLRNFCAAVAGLRVSSVRTVDFVRVSCETLGDAYGGVSPHSYRGLMSFEAIHALVMI